MDVRRLILVIGLALPGAFITADTPAVAHVVRLGTVPESGAVLAHAPRRVELRFSGAIESRFGEVGVLDPRGRRVDDGTVLRPAAARLAVDLPAGLAPGRYTTTYRLVSLDGHAVTGSVPFSITAGGADPGDDTAAPPVVASGTGPLTQGALAVARAVSYAAVALVLGVVLFLLVCWAPALKAAGWVGLSWTAASAEVAKRSWRMLGAGSAIGLVAGFACLWLYTASVAGASAWDVLDRETLGAALDTRTGGAYALRLGLLALTTLALVAVRMRGGLPVLRQATLGATGAVAHPGGMTPPVAALLVTLGLALAAIPALAGHAGTTDPVALMVGLDAVHVVAMAAWLGGLAVALVVVAALDDGGRDTERTGLVAAVLGRFSAVALLSVVALAVTGVIASVVHLEAPGDLVSSAYGRALVVKTVLFAALVGIGAVNRHHALPALRRAAAIATAAPATRLLRRALRIEVILLLVVLCVTGILVGLGPPSPA